MIIYWSEVLDAPEYVRTYDELSSLFGIDNNNNNPSGRIRWGRFGKRIINSN